MVPTNSTVANNIDLLCHKMGGGGTCLVGVYNVSGSRCVFMLPKEPFDKEIFIGHGTKFVYVSAKQREG